MLAISPFVGRQAERDALARVLDRALDGHGGAVIIGGDPGIGKTRLAEELAASARTRGAVVLWARCDEWSGAPAYWPWITILRALIDEVAAAAQVAPAGVHAADLAQILPELRDCRPVQAAPPVDPEQARFRLFEAAAAVLATAARRHPLVLVLDDLHWADPPTILLLRFVAQQTRDLPVLLVGTYRPDLDRQHPLREVLVDLARHQASHGIPLHGLSVAEVGRYLALVTGETPSAELIAAIHGKTEGNPFFLTETVRLFTGEAELNGMPPRWTVPVPASVGEVIERRFARLPASCYEVLATAAVAGREFSLSLLQRAGDRGGTDLLELLDAAMQVRVIEQTAVGRYRFSHILFQETLYNGLSSARRAHLHARLGEALEQIHAAEIERVLPDLARHFFEAAALGQAARAVAYAVRAAEQANAQVAWEEAVVQYERALQALEFVAQPDAGQRIEILIALGEAQFRSGDAKAAAATRRRLLPLIRGHGTLEQKARVAISHGLDGWGYPFTDEDTRTLLADVLASLPAGDSVPGVQVRARLATSLHNVPGTLERRAALLADAVAMARRLGDQAALGFASIAHVPTFWEPDQRHRWQTAIDEAAHVAETTDDLLLTSHVHLAQSIVAIEDGDLARGDDELARYAGIKSRLRLPSSHWELVTRRTGRALLEGRFAQAEQLAREALELGTRVYPVEWQPEYEYWSLIFLLRQLQGRLAEIEPEVQRLLEQHRRDPYWLSRFALLAAELGRLDEARSIFERLAADGFSAVASGPWWDTRLVPLAEVCVLLGDRERAATLSTILAPFADRNIHELTIYYGAGAYYPGILAALCSRWEDASRQFEAALALNERRGAKPFLARTRCAYGAMLLRHGRAEDRARTVELLGEALGTARELGMASLMRDAERLLAALGAHGRAPAARSADGAGRMPLTPRELEVVRLIAAGRTNREIAAELVLSVRTVERHIETIYGKLGLHGKAARAALAAHALAHGLIHPVLD